MALAEPTTVQVSDIEMHAGDLDPARAAAIYAEHGCLVVRGLMGAYAEAIGADVVRSMEQAIRLYEAGRYRQTNVGLSTPVPPP